MNNGKPVFSQELLTLYKISQAIVRHKNVNALLNEVLDILDQLMNAQRATLTLYYVAENALLIEASKGLSAAEKSRGRYSLGEGITGEVAEEQKSVIIENVSNDPRFLDRTKARKNANLSFICVPIVKAHDLIGTISIDLNKVNRQTLNTACQLLEIIANLLADAVNQIRQQNEEKANLKAENNRLHKELGNSFYN